MTLVLHPKALFKPNLSTVYAIRRVKSNRMMIFDVTFDIDIVFVHYFRNIFVLKRLVFHDMAPAIVYG